MDLQFLIFATTQFFLVYAGHLYHGQQVPVEEVHGYDVAGQVVQSGHEGQILDNTESRGYDLGQDHHVDYYVSLNKEQKKKIIATFPFINCRKSYSNL